MVLPGMAFSMFLGLVFFCSRIGQGSAILMFKVREVRGYPFSTNYPIITALLTSILASVTQDSNITLV